MQAWITALIVIAAFCAVIRRYAPKALMRAVRRRLARLAQRRGWSALAVRLETTEQDAGSCSGGCGPCGGCAANEKISSPVAESVVPLHDVKRFPSR